MKFGFILQKPQQYFYQQFAEKLAGAVRVNVDIQGQCEIVWAEVTSPKEFAELIERMAKTCDVIAAVATDCLQVSTAVAEAKARGGGDILFIVGFCPRCTGWVFGCEQPESWEQHGVDDYQYRKMSWESWLICRWFALAWACIARGGVSELFSRTCAAISGD